MTDAIGHAVAAGVGYLRLSGDLRHDTAGALEALIEQWFAGNPAAVDSVVIDLNQARFMDSTVIGLLANIARELQVHGLPKATVFSTQTDINQLLRCLCLDQVFTLVEQATNGSVTTIEQTAMAADGADAHCSASAILKAHEVLVELNEGNREAFQPVVDLLRGELGRTQ